MDRSELQRLLSCEADAELDPQDRDRLAQGLRDDPSAAGDRALFSLIGSAIREEPEGEVPAGLQGRILDRIRQEVEVPVGPEGEVAMLSRAPLLFLRRSALVAAAVLLITGLVHVAQLPGQAFAGDPGPAEHFVPGEELIQVLDEREQDGDGPPKLLSWLLGRKVEDDG